MSKKLLQAAAGNAGESLYVEDVFSIYLYSGTGAALDITDGIDYANEGGMVWIKARDDTTDHAIFDTERGATKRLETNNTDAEATTATSLTAFNADGYSLGTFGQLNNGTKDYVSWGFRKAEKFFDVVTYTGTGSGPRVINHNLGANIGFLLIKCTSNADNWYAHHASVNFPLGYGFLDTTDSWNTTGSYVSAADDTSFTLSGVGNNVSGRTYVAYLFASDAGGFGDDGSESIIKCGSVTTTSGGYFSVDLGFEPQWVLIKTSSEGGSWYLTDNLRGYVTYGTSGTKYLLPNSSGAEGGISNWGINSTGFEGSYGGASGINLIYIAIRRPMKTPESASEVFNNANYAGNSSSQTYSNGFPVDLIWQGNRPDVEDKIQQYTRLTGTEKLITSSTAAGAGATFFTFDEQDSVSFTGNANAFNVSGDNYVCYNFKRAPGFMDVVCYKGTGSAHAEDHGLGVVPEMMIVKHRGPTGTYAWVVYHKDNTANPETDYLLLNSNAATADLATIWNDTAPTATQFTVGTNNTTNISAENYLALLFATLDGVSKVGSYTGTGADLNVDCGFSAGARFILIKRTDSAGDWYVWDSVRGIVAGNDPYLLLNSTAAEVTGTDYIDPLNAGFTVTSSAPAALNASGGSYIFLAIS